MPTSTAQLIRVFARYEPTTDPVAISNLCQADLARARDVAIYRDAAATQRMARFNCDRTKPNRRTKVVTLNCWNWAIKWLPSQQRTVQVPLAAKSVPAANIRQ